MIASGVRDLGSRIHAPRHVPRHASPATVGLAAISVCAVAAGMATPTAGALVLSAFLGISLIRERALMAAITGELIGLLRGRE